MTAIKRNKCSCFPKSYQEPICLAGSDVSGVTKDSYLCSEEYAETCPWFREMEKEVASELGLDEPGIDDIDFDEDEEFDID